MSFFANVRRIFSFSSLSFFFVLLTLFCIPLFYLPFLRSTWDLPKEVLLYTSLSIIFVLTLFEIVKTKKIQQKRTVLDKPFFLLLVAGFFSTMLSKNISLSFWGLGDTFVLHFFALFLFVAWAWILIQKIESEKLFRRAVFVFLLSGVFASLFFLSFEFFNLFGTQVFNPVAKLNSVFGIYIVTLFTLSLGTLVSKTKNNMALVLLSLVCAVLTLISIFRLDFQILWGLLAFGMALLFLLAMAFWGAVRKSVLACTFVLFLFSLSHLLLPNILSFGRALPSEINLNREMSQTIVETVLQNSTKNFLLGSGPGTFVYDFSLFRPI